MSDYKQKYLKYKKKYLDLKEQLGGMDLISSILGNKSEKPFEIPKEENVLHKISCSSDPADNHKVQSLKNIQFHMKFVVYKKEPNNLYFIASHNNRMSPIKEKGVIKGYNPIEGMEEYLNNSIGVLVDKIYYQEKYTFYQEIVVTFVDPNLSALKIRPVKGISIPYFTVEYLNGESRDELSKRADTSMEIEFRDLTSKNFTFNSLLDKKSFKFLSNKSVVSNDINSDTRLANIIMK